MANCKEIWMKDNFTASTADALRKEIIDISTANPRIPIIVHINSYGGSVDALNMLIDTFNQVPNEIITVCLGTAMSAGAVLLSCGDKRFVGKHARIMIHEVSAGAIGTTTEISDQLAEIKRMNKVLLTTLSKNTGKSLKEIKSLLKETPDLYFTPKTAVEFGIADYVGVPSIFETSEYHLLVDNKKLLTSVKKKKKLTKKEKK